MEMLLTIQELTEIDNVSMMSMDAPYDERLMEFARRIVEANDAKRMERALPPAVSFTEWIGPADIKSDVGMWAAHIAAGMSTPKPSWLGGGKWVDDKGWKLHADAAQRRAAWEPLARPGEVIRLFGQDDPKPDPATLSPAERAVNAAWLWEGPNEPEIDPEEECRQWAAFNEAMFASLTKPEGPPESEADRVWRAHKGFTR